MYGAVSINYPGATSHVVHEICSSQFYPRQQTVENDSKGKAWSWRIWYKAPSQALSDTSIHSFGELKGNLTSFHMRVPRPIDVMWTRRPSCWSKWRRICASFFL